jgi:O-antigen ligase
MYITSMVMLIPPYGPRKNTSIKYHILFLKNFILSILHLLTCVYIIWATSPTSPASGQNLFHPLVLWFCQRKNIKDIKKNIVFLLVWDKASYTGRFLMLFPCLCVLQPKLTHVLLLVLKINPYDPPQTVLSSYQIHLQVEYLHTQRTV